MTLGKHEDIDRAWSPDGRYLAYASSRGMDNKRVHNYDVRVMNADGSGRPQLTTNGSEDIQPRWGPEGKYIYFISNRGGAWNIWRIEIKQIP